MHLSFNEEEVAKLLGCEETPHKISLQLPGKHEPELLTPLQFYKLMDIHYWPTLHLSSLSFLNEIVAKCPLLITHTFWGAENRELGALYKMNLWSGAVADVTIKWIDNRIGFGVFADKDLKEGDYIGEFTGDVRRINRSNPAFNAYCFHYSTRFWSRHYCVVDASKGGNETRFINHSDNPNLIPMCLWDRSLLHIVFFAKKSIPAGAQLTYDYGKDFWQYREKIDL